MSADDNKRRLDRSLFDSEEEVEVIVRESIDSVLDGILWDPDKLDYWNAAICERALEGLSTLKLWCKYIVHCAIMQLTDRDSRMTVGCASYWDPERDGGLVVRWENDYMFVTVTIFGIST